MGGFPIAPHPPSAFPFFWEGTYSYINTHHAAGLFPALFFFRFSPGRVQIPPGS